MVGWFKGVMSFPGVLMRNRDLLGAFVFRELRSRFEGSLLGRLWPILNPAILVTIYYLVFVKIMGMKLEQGNLDPNGYVPGLGLKPETAMGLYLITGILPWLAFAESMIRSTSAVIEHANLIKKVAFPSELLVTYLALVNLVFFLISLPIYFVLHYFVANVISPHVVWLPVIIALQLAFTVGLGMLLSTLNVFVRDTAQFVGLGVMLWMFLTPIFYPAEMALRKIAGTPDGAPFESTLGTDIFMLNPMYHLMACYRSAFLRHDLPFPWESLGKFAIVTGVVLVIGLAVYHAAKDRFADEV